ncbi:MAG: DUF3990 domain-containing protein [Ruminococcaceae bacterium]|nr:DUF3990 domain-containing protein [Oscillospiraceae bacterium]
MSILKLYHGSDRIISAPEYGVGKSWNDYGKGFYCTESIELAKEWACSEENKNGYANAYTIDTEGLTVLNLSDEKYNILNWLAILLQNRVFDLSLPVSIRARDYIIENFNVDIKNADIIIGYRADDSYFSFAKDFVNNSINLDQLSNAMRLGKLCEQIVIMSKKAFDRLVYIEDETEFADADIYYPKRVKRDEEAKKQYLDTERFEIDLNGLFINDFIRRKMTNEDF